MLAKKTRRLLKAALKPVSIMIIPHSGLPSLRFNFSLLVLLALGSAWTGFTLWAGYISGRQADYYVTKADNHMLRTRMDYMAMKVEKGLHYLEMTKRTDAQIRKIVGMGGRPDLAGSVGGPDASDIADFKKLLARKNAAMNDEAMSGAISRMQEESRERLSSYTEITWYLANKHNLAKALPSIWPADGRITSRFGYRVHPIRFSSEYHSGVDIANDAGTPLVATADGVVRHTGWISGYGIAVLIDHGFGYSTLYGHMTESLVKEGAAVKRGQRIGLMGTTGTSTGSHVHYEVLEGGVPKNPERYFNAGGKTTFFAGVFEGLMGPGR
ncbi:MAG TPA: hypothetical protein DDW67_00535 [Elusimicrobia bacterium]|jgi:murein DD-endopeptidase MepM/ murein hydrolase activator NlpD|nr:hypothetical protein [Elusimicrobiota bacterium]